MAQLCALDLLQAAAGAGARAPDITVMGFATPAVGNAALATHAAARGWAGRFVTYLLPGAMKSPIPPGSASHMHDSPFGPPSCTCRIFACRHSSFMTCSTL